MTPPSKLWRFLNPLTHNQKLRVLFAGPHFHAGLSSTISLLQSRGTLNSFELIHAPTRTDILNAAPNVEIALPFMEFFDEEFLERATKLRLVQQFGVGLERVDVPFATQHGIAVSNVPALHSANAQATAEHALLLSMMLLRHVTTELPRRLRERELGGLPLPRTIFGKNVTVVGYGSVGSTLCHYLIEMGANVTAIRSRNWCPILDEHVRATKLSCITEALPTTDILILACTVTPDTWHLVNDQTLSLLPSNAIVVNVGRGPLVEYHSILSALKEGTIGGYASDVGVGHDTKPSEPWDPNDELSLLPNTIFTPHVGGYTDVSYGEEGSITRAVVEGMESVLLEGCPIPVW
eukprot:CAMPEP_0183703542 /NCGR_PEP_ID=MMETSP0737-20130205/1246_1 /TAXON_ID=385413 /ORGANISM="Thalassiosira miniscula, Strain CCMP1093" /LENGTH=349 /DNA_ID=CAMNT_0025930313 /DNA_START=33 /DNA_END=1079 /DNA_ORIENTATION=+